MPTPSPIAFLLRGRVRRGLAVLLGAIVFSLGLLAFAPDAHATLHDDQHEGGDSCVVELFAQGITTVVAAPLVEAPPLRGAAKTGETPCPFPSRPSSAMCCCSTRP